MSDTGTKTRKLMVKTHKVTGLKYLCVTGKDDFYDYPGSGVYWKKHLRIHGRLFDTKLIYESNNMQEFSDMCIYYSRLWNVVNAINQQGQKIWANLIIENGLDGGPAGNDHYSKRGGYVKPSPSKEAIDKRSGALHWTKKEESRHILDKVREKTSGKNHYSNKNGYVKPKISNEHRLKMSGENHYSAKKGFESKIKGDNNPARRADVRNKLSGKNHSLFDHTVYIWINEKLNLVVHSTRYYLIHQYDLSAGAISDIINKPEKHKSHRGWKLGKNNELQK